MGGFVLAITLTVIYAARDLIQVYPIYKDIMKKLKEQ